MAQLMLGSMLVIKPLMTIMGRLQSGTASSRMSAGLPRMKEPVQSTKGYRTAINGLPSMYQNPYISSKAVRL